MIETIRNALWSLPTVGFLTGMGVYFTFKSRFYPLFHPRKVVKSIFSSSSKEGISPFRGMMTALGGTVGVGSITGIAFAVKEGGKGALFWMWVCAFFSMMLKYAENYIAVKYKDAKQNIGGASVILKKSGKPFLAVFFACAVIIASFGSGNTAQASAFSQSAQSLGLSPMVIGLFFSLLLLPAVWGGQKTVAKINGVLVPIAGTVFILGMLGIIILNFRHVPAALSGIVKDALGLNQIYGGTAGYGIAAAIRVGVSKGVFSHEAGMGSAPMAYAASQTTKEQAGNYGIAEIFADTFLVGTLTALGLITSGFETAEDMVYGAYGSAGNTVLAMLIGIFAYSAVISWCFYSESCIKFLWGDSLIPLYLYRISVIIAAFAGCIVSSQTLWSLADIFNALMLIPNLYILIIKRKEILF